jgi:hypothetical protein
MLDLLAQYHHFARTGWNQGRKNTQQSCFTSAIGTDDSHNLPFGDLEADRAQGLDPAIRKRKVLDLQEQVGFGIFQ